MRNGDRVKYLPAAKLAPIIAALPPDSRIYVNEVGNLMVCTVDDLYLGYIDFASEGEFIKVSP